MGKADEAKTFISKTTHAKRTGKTEVKFFFKDVTGQEALKTGNWNTNTLKELKDF